jgi:subtilisin family serine protease
MDSHLNSILRSGPQRPRLRALRVAAAVGVTAAVITAGGIALAEEPEGTITDTGSTAVVSGSYIVVYKDGANPSATDLTARYGGHVNKVYQHSIRGFAVSGITEQQAKRLATNKDIARVERDAIVQAQPDAGVHAQPDAGVHAQPDAGVHAQPDAGVRAAGTDEYPRSWGVDRIDQRHLPLDKKFTYPGTASDVTAYVIGTGFDVSNSDFDEWGESRAVKGVNTAPDDPTGCSNWHDTHVAGIIGSSFDGVARQVKLVSVRVHPCQGPPPISYTIAGVDWVTGNHAPRSVAYLTDVAQANATLDEAVQRSIDAGVTFVVRAGDDSADACRVSPARVRSVITVGATNEYDGRYTRSNYGGCLDVFAPGEKIMSVAESGWQELSGTAQAAGHVAGAAALVLSAHPDFSPQQIHDFLVNNATPDVVRDAGARSPNKLLYIGGLVS